MKRLKHQKDLNQFFPALIIDDDILCQKIIYRQLTYWGYQVQIAGTAEVAIESLNNKVYCLILTNLGFPGQSGIVVIQAARKGNLNQTTFLIVCTAHANKKTVQGCLLLGANKVLVKPVQLDVLQEAFEQSLVMKEEVNCLAN